MNFQRIKSIDIFRGLAIILMIFFTLLIRLSITPDFLSHNVKGILHFGDFVLPMFLFASGLSLPFFVKKRKEKGTKEMILDIIEKLGKLTLISVIITPFSAGGVLYMDEMMLNTILFLPALLLTEQDEKLVLGLSVFILFSYFLLFPYMQTFFDQYYLGGYQGAIFYLPVMLGGVVVGKRIIKRRGFTDILLVYATLNVALLLMIFPDKMKGSPSFMTLSIVASLISLYVISEINSRINSNIQVQKIFNFLEYCGRKPLRFWILLFLVFVIPLTFYVALKTNTFPLGINWKIGVLFSTFAIICLYFVSKLIDKIEVWYQKT
ncbi:MAG: heparan-alpha-glucosaminide N-acetyltransferase domain-containing protein [Candidatus Micrarchaeota archaeon]